MLINDAYVYDGYVFDKDFKMVMGPCEGLEGENCKRQLEKAEKMVRREDVSLVEEESVLINTGNISYCHWLNDNLYRVLCAKEKGLLDRKFIVNYNNGTQLESLIRCGVDYNNIINGVGPFLIKHLYCFEYRSGFDKSFNRELILDKKTKFSMLRQLFLNKLSICSSGKRIYISRNAGNAKRKIVNEDEVEELLKKYGFEKIHLEDRTISDQANIIYNADFIVSPHGAGLFNLIFCNTEKDVKVIEIFGNDLNQTVKTVTCHYNNIRHLQVIHEEVDKDHGIRVDVALLEESLTDMDLYSAIDRAYVINLDEKTDRWNRIMGEFDRIGFPRSKIQRISAINRERIPKNVLEKIKETDGFKSKMRVNSFCVLMSHSEVIKTLLEHEGNIFWVFEDDCEFHPDFKKMYREYIYNKLPEDFGIFYFFGLNDLGKDFCGRKKEGTVALHSQLVNKGNAKLLNEYFNWSISTYFENFWSVETHDADWVYKNLSQAIPTYCTKTITRQTTDFLSDRTGCEIAEKKFYNEN